MKTAEIIDVLHKISARIEKEKDFLTELDNVIGDGDHGINMARGFRAVDEKLNGLSEKTPADVLKAVGIALVSTVGGASGPLYGTGFMRMGGALDGKDDIAIGDFAEALKGAVEGISSRGRSHQGEKTMLDSMIPALKTIEECLSEGGSAKKALESGCKAAWDGVEYTKTIAATKGRASYLGERSIGHQDPGATSFSMMLEVLKESV